MLVFMHIDHFPHTLLFLLSLLIRHGQSLGIQFTSPAGGATLPAGPITIGWSDAGGNPDMSQLQTYTLDLMVGGVNPDDSISIHTIGKPGAMVSDGGVSGNIPASVAQSIQNGFYLRMTANTSDENEALNYSDRFTLINMNGTTENQYLQAANAAGGDVANVPSAQYNLVIGQPSTTTQPSSPTSTTTTTPTETSTATPTEPPRPDVSGMSGMSKGLVIMAGLLAVVGAISIVLWVVFCCRRVRKKKQRNSESSTAKEIPDDDFSLGSKTELAAYRSSRAVDTPTTPIEMDGQRERQELAAQDKAQELRAPSMIYELEGDMSAWEAGSGRRSKAWEAV